ncbi:MAG: DUF4276 family protein [Thioploca sp.]|nr:DUF4276 family protein [Thioploca sp.]
MYGVLGEDKSDVEILKVLIRKLAANEKITIKTKGYSGGGEMMKQGKQQLNLFKNLGCCRFIICYDADGEKLEKRYEKVVNQIVTPSDLKKEAAIGIVIPVQEIEAWILANIEVVTQIFRNWQPKPVSNPESIDHPKEYLEKLSRDAKGKPRYSHAIHNARVAQYLNLNKIRQKCPSFKPLVDLVTLGTGNYPKNLML